MKRTLSMIALAALTIGLLGSCSKINERLDNLDKRIDGLENEQIASINTQIANINSSIADLGQIRSDISSLKQSAETHGQEIFALQEADETLRNRILNLEDYIDGILPKYAEKEWVEATFSTLEQYEATCDTIAKIDARIGALDAKLSKDIKATADSLTKWVNKTFEGYYTAAQMDAKLAQMKAAVDSAKASGGITDAKADSIATELTNAKAAVDTAKANIRAEYKAAVKSAIEESEGKLTKALNDAIATVNGTITALTGRVDALETSVAALTGRVDALEGMIQSVTIVPAYNDGSVEAKAGFVTVNIIVEPASAVAALDNSCITVFVNTVKTKSVSLDTAEVVTLEKDTETGIVSILADVSEYLPKGEDKALTVAVNIKNGISDFTTEFVPVTPIVEYVEIAAKYDGSTVSTLRWYRQSLAITESGKKAWKDDSGSPVKVPGTDEDVVVGDYFQWGTFTGFYGNGAGTDKGLLPYTSFTSTGCGDGSDAFTFKSGKQFNQTNAPYWSGSAYTKYNATDGKTTLEASDDVASIVLGGTWRMPTTKEFQAMKGVTYWAWDATDKGYYVYTPNPASDAGKVNDGTGTYNKADALLFFPTAGNGYENTYYDVETIADYWYGSLNSESIGSACHLFFNSSGGFNADSRDSERFRGFSVRPVQDPAATYKAVTGVSLDVTAKEIEAGGNVQLKVTVAPATATQNGVYWTSSAPAVATVDATGKVTAVAVGTATITATTVDGSKTATCVVTVKAEIKTIADVLATVVGGFPNSSDQKVIPDNAWVADVPNNRKCYAYTSTSGSTTALLLRIPPVGEAKGNYTPLLTSLDVTKENNCYTVIYNNNYGKLTFNMAENKLTSIKYEPINDGAKPFAGTYTAPTAN